MPVTWRDVISHPQFQSLTQEEREDARAYFFDTQIAPKIPETEIGNVKAYWDEKTSFDNTMTFGDVGQTFKSGVGGLSTGLGQIAEYVAGPSDVSESLKLSGAATQREAEEGLSNAGYLAKKNALFPESDTSITGLGIGKTPWQTAFLMATESLPGTIATIPVGSALAGALGKAGSFLLGKTAGGAATQAAAAGIGKSATYGQLAEGALGTGLAGKVVGAAPTALGYGAAEGLLAAGQNAAQTQEQILATPFDKLQGLTDFQSFVDRNDGDLNAARLEMAQEAANQVFNRTAISTGVIGALTGGGAVGAAARGTHAKEGLLKAAGKGFGEEAIQEAPQSGVEHIIQQQAAKEYQDRTIDPTKGAWRATVEGGAVGGLTGVGFGVGGRLMQRGEGPPLPGGPSGETPPPGQPPPDQDAPPSEPILKEGDVESPIDTALIAQGRQKMLEAQQASEMAKNGPPVADLYPIGEMVNITFPGRNGPQTVDRVVIGHKGSAIIVEDETGRPYQVPTTKSDILVSKATPLPPYAEADKYPGVDTQAGQQPAIEDMRAPVAAMDKPQQPTPTQQSATQPTAVENRVRLAIETGDVDFLKKILTSGTETSKKAQKAFSEQAAVKLPSEPEAVKETVSQWAGEKGHGEGISAELSGMRPEVGIDPMTIKEDPKRFQFKETVGMNRQTGETNVLSQEREWDASTAGNLLIWENKAGERFIVDGHQRLAFAKRLAAQGKKPLINAFVKYERDGVTAKDAVRIGAENNIKQATNSTKATDVARFIRAGGDLSRLNYLSERRPFLRDGKLLAGLSDQLFRVAVDDEDQVPMLAAIVKGVKSVETKAFDAKTDMEKIQQSIYSAVRGRGYAPRVVETTAREISLEQSGRKLAQNMKSQSLFGDDDPVFAAIGIKANILDEAGKILRAERTVTRSVAKGGDVMTRKEVATGVDQGKAAQMAEEETAVLRDLSRRASVGGELYDRMESLVSRVGRDEITAVAAGREFAKAVASNVESAVPPARKAVTAKKAGAAQPKAAEAGAGKVVVDELAEARKGLKDAQQALSQARTSGASGEAIAEASVLVGIMRQSVRELEKGRTPAGKESSVPTTGATSRRPAQTPTRKPVAASAEPKPSMEVGHAARQAEIDKLFDELDAFGKRLNAGVDPEVARIMIKISVLYIKQGFVKIGEWMHAVYSHPKFPKNMTAYLKGWYNDVKMFYAKIIDTSQMSSRREVADYVFDPNAGIEQDRQGAGEIVEDAVRQEGVPASDGGGRPRGRQAGEIPGGSQRADIGDRGVRDSDAAPVGEQGDSGVPEGERIRVKLGLAVGRDDRGGRVSGRSRLSDGGVRAGSVEGIVEASPEVEVRSPKDISDDLPELMPHQLQNVAKAERRFDAHHGFMITDGTGTGKTYSGVGVIKRFYLAAKRNILLVGPSDQVLLQWSNLLNIFGIKHSKLDGTKDGGSGVSITTLSNFSANKALQSRLFDLVLIDEAHKLLAEQKGTTNLAVRSLRANTLHPDGLRDRARAQLPELSEQVQKAQADFESMQDSLWSERGRAREELVRLNRKLDAEINKKVEQFKGEPRPKVLFLSATPFAYVPALDYAEGFLFEYGEESGRPLRYNEPSPKQRFYIQHFGYSMRVNKLTQPEGGVDSGVMERRFHEHLKRENALTSTVLEIAQDYDRRFVIVDNAVGNKIDEVLAFLDKSENRRYRPIEEIITARFKYHERARLLEALKAESAIKIIQDHLDLGRKVVVFHDFNEGGGFNPFERPGDIDIRSEFVLKKGATNEHETVRLAVLWDEFEAANPFIKQAEWSALPSPIVTIKRAFKNSAVFNGEIKKDARADAVKSFNSDEAGSINVIIAQSRAMSEGVSLHDLTGKHQRVILHLGMPTRPTDAIQQEGRIYRVGMKTNAIFRYLNTGTLWERYAFVSKISERIGTAENLGMGDKARTLQRSFIDAFMDSGHYQASQDDGIGGKEQDRQQRETSPFELAKSLYFGQQKTAGRRDQRAGKDYYATPEPIGLKMVEWADIKTGDHVLEPSAGHGAISRWFPEGANTTIVEPSAELLSRAQLNVTQPHTRSIHGTFEDLHISNKFDAIVMNPPFGVGGKTAIEHVAKAAKHLRVGGRMVALIPQGRGFDRLTEWLDSDAGDGMRTIGVISLPAVAFERAGTSVRTVVVVLDKVPSKNLADLSTTKRVDLSNRETIKELFDSVEDVTIPSRVEMTQQEEREVGVDAEVVEESASDTPQASYLRLQHNLEARFDENAGTYHLVGLSRRPSNDTWKIKERIREVGGGKWNRIEKRWEFPADPTVKLAEILGYKEEPNVRFALANAGSQEAGTTRKPRLAKSVVQSAIAPALESFKAGIERNGVHVEVVQTIHDLLNRKQITKLTQDDYRKLRNAKGFYLPKDRKIVLIANNIESGRDARNTLNHELAVHFGLDLLGREAKTEFLREVALSMKQEKNRADYEKVVEKYKDLTEAEIAEEFFAYVTESAEPGLRALADKLITRVIGLFRKIGWMRNYPMTLSEMRDFARSLAQGIREGKDRADLPKSIATAKTPVAGKQTVNVDGKDRPTVNSDGQPLHWSVEGVRNFWRWLGDSKAVDGNGRPVAVYRGTGDDFGSTKPFLPGVSGKAENEKTLQAVKDAIGRVLQTGSARMLYTAYVREEDSDVMFVVEHADGGEVRMSQGDGFQSAADDALEIPFTPITGNETLEVDGKSRPTMNSNGQPIHWSEEGVRNFWRWFGDSKVVDGEGRPLVMYHGTNRSESGIAAFDVYGSNYGLFGTGSYFTDNPSVAGGYATAKRSWEKGSPTIYPVYIKNDTPLDMNAKADQQEWEAGFPDVDFDVFEPTSKTNEGYLRAVEEYFENEGWVRDEASQAITENIVNMGYSGVTHIGGGRITQDGPKHRVHIVYEPEQVKSATGNFGTFDPENPDIRYSLINPLTNPKPVKEWFAEASDNMARRFQNRFKDIWNRKMHPVIQALTLQPGRIGEAIHDFNVENVHPLIQAIKDAGIGYDEVEQVLRALHTQEANAHLKDLHERLGTDLGGRDKDALSGETNDWARGVLSKYTKASLMAAGKTESEAIRIRNKLADISAMVARIADATLFKWEESGMITPEKSFIYQNMFQHYIPMHREGFDDSPVQGRGIHVPSKPVKSRTGSDLEVVDVLAHLIGQHEAAIILAEKATVGRALYNWFKANPDPNFVQFKPAPVSRNIADPDIIEKNQAWMQQDHVLRVMFDGHERFMVFNKHNKVALRMVMAIKGMTDNGIPHYLRWFAEMGRFFTGLLTKYSVDFMLTNLARDIETAFANVSGTQAEGRAVEMVKGIPAAFAAIRESQKGGADHPLSKDLYEWRRRGGKTGFTVYYDNASSRTKDLKWQLRMLQDDPTAKGLRAGKALIDAFGNMNDALEGATRLSAYVQARKAGMSEDEAAVFSKNITVNFNQRGEYGSIVNMLFWFFNANVQGTTRMMKAVLTSRGAKLATGITMLGFSVTLASLLLGGGDDKEKPEDDALLRLAPGDEAKNAFIRFWDGDVFKIPLAWGYNLFYLAGAKAAQQLYRQINGMPTHAVDAAGEMLLAAFEAFSPVGTSPTALQFFTPSIAKPFQQVAENRAWHGGPVRPRENVFDRSNKPAYTQHFAKTSDVFVGMSKGLHSLTKRDTGPAILDIYPDSLQHVFDSFAGGPGRLVRQLTTITQKSLEGDMVGITTQNIPILRRFWGLNVDGVEKNRFYDSVEAVATLEGRIKMAIKDRDDKERLRLLKDNAKLLPMIGQLKTVDSQTKLVSDRIKLLKTARDKTPKAFDMIRDLEKRQLTIMKNFSNSVERAMQ